MQKNVLLTLTIALAVTACAAPKGGNTQKAAPVVDVSANANRKPAREVAATPATAPAPATASGGGYLPGDGPGADSTCNSESMADIVPKAEPLHRYANRPYSALGKTYTPLTKAGSYKERGIASWYGKKFHGQRTSIGEIYDMYGMTAAHPTLPIPSYARVTNVATGKSVIVRVNDRGPFLHDRIMDLSYAAACKLGYINSGSTEVEVESMAVEGSGVVSASANISTVTVAPLTAVPEASSIPVDTEGSVKGRVFLQLGAFKSRQGAESFLSRMRTELGDGGAKRVRLYEKGRLIRVHYGPYATAEEARSEAGKLAVRLGFRPFVSLH